MKLNDIKQTISEFTEVVDFIEKIKKIKLEDIACNNIHYIYDISYDKFSTIEELEKKEFFHFPLCILFDSKFGDFNIKLLRNDNNAINSVMIDDKLIDINLSKLNKLTINEADLESMTDEESDEFFKFKVEHDELRHKIIGIRINFKKVTDYFIEKFNIGPIKKDINVDVDKLMDYIYENGDYKLVIDKLSIDTFNNQLEFHCRYYTIDPLSIDVKLIAIFDDKFKIKYIGCNNNYIDIEKNAAELADMEDILKLNIFNLATKALNHFSFFNYKKTVY